LITCTVSADIDQRCKANVLIDSECRGRLADFGLTVVIDESTTGSTTHHRGMRGTVRWMAPEVMYPEKFGFDGEYRKRLPSRSTDIYALGMTILEVSIRPHDYALRYHITPWVGYHGPCSVRQHPYRDGCHMQSPRRGPTG